MLQNFRADNFVKKFIRKRHMLYFRFLKKKIFGSNPFFFNISLFYKTIRNVRSVSFFYFITKGKQVVAGCTASIQDYVILMRIKHLAGKKFPEIIRQPDFVPWIKLMIKI